MLQIAFIRQNMALVKERLAIKNFGDIHLVDEIVLLDDTRKKLQLEFDTNQAKINAASKEIGQLMAKGGKEEAEARKQEVATLKTSLQPISEQLAETEKQLQENIVKLPNLPSDKVPAGKTPADNITIREGGKKPSLPDSA